MSERDSLEFRLSVGFPLRKPVQTGSAKFEATGGV